MHAALLERQLIKVPDVAERIELENLKQQLKKEAIKLSAESDEQRRGNE
jgi:hypothetical protein